MSTAFLPEIDAMLWKELTEHKDYEQLYALLTEPLHAALYKRQDFNFMDELSEGQQLLLSYDYLRNQALQGGFIQFIQNGYTGLLLPMPEWLQRIGAGEMAQIIDDALKVYVLNHELLDKQTTPEEFARLYDELKEYEQLDEQFLKQNDDAIHKMMQYAADHPDQFVKRIYLA